MFALVCLGTAAIFAILSAVAEKIGLVWLERASAYGGTIVIGYALAAGIGALIGLVWPAVGKPATVVLCLWWTWGGWRYASQRDRQHAMQEAVVSKRSEASIASADAEAEACYALIQEVRERVGGAVVFYNGVGGVLMHPELAKALDQAENAHLRDGVALILGRFRHEPRPARSWKKR
jgi:hypothetical protein